MSKYKKYHPPINSNVNKSHNKSINNTAIGNEDNIINDNYKKLFKEKLEENKGIAKEIFIDENLTDSNIHSDDENGNNRLNTVNVFPIGKMNYNEWNKYNKKQIKTSHYNKKDINRKDSISPNFLLANKINSQLNLRKINSLEHSFNSTSFQTKNKEPPALSQINRNNISLNSISKEITENNNINNNSLLTNISIMKYLKKTFGENLERFDEKSKIYILYHLIVLFQKLDESSIQEVIRELILLAYSQESLIKEYSSENKKLKDIIQNKNFQINELSDELTDIKSNLLQLVTPGSKQTNSKNRSKAKKQ